MITETQVLAAISADEALFSPFSFRLVEKRASNTTLPCDALVEALWGTQVILFAASLNRSSSDRVVGEAMRESCFAAKQLSVHPLVIVPWLSDEQLKLLEREAVSGLDLCGNGVIVIPEKILVLRSGKPNSYRDTRMVRNVYEGTSSLVARAFLLRPTYDSVAAVVQEIQARSGNITQPTVSKALKQLEADVVIWREVGLLKLLQGEKLLERLATNFKLPRQLGVLTGKLAGEPEEVAGLLSAAAKKCGAKIVVTGACSVNQYSTMARESMVEFYSSMDVAKLSAALGPELDASSRFPNFRVIYTDDQTVFFDARLEQGRLFASPLQCYLELVKGDKREVETALRVRTTILGAFELQGSESEELDEQNLEAEDKELRS